MRDLGAILFFWDSNSVQILVDCGIKLKMEESYKVLNATLHKQIVVH